MNTLLTVIQEIDGLIKENRELRVELANRNHNNKAKLSKADVKHIRELHRSGVSQAEIAQLYDVNPTTVSRTVRNFYH